MSVIGGYFTVIRTPDHLKPEGIFACAKCQRISPKSEGVQRVTGWFTRAASNRIRHQRRTRLGRTVSIAEIRAA